MSNVLGLLDTPSYKEKAQTKWPNFEEEADERKNFPENIAYL